MSRVQLYPLKTPISQIHQHHKIPSSARELGKCIDRSANKLYFLVKQHRYLSVLIAYHAGPQDQYYWALEGFRKSPSEGGLHAGAMTTKDMEVDGEMLCVQNTTDGYALVNRSRNKQDPISDYDDAGAITIIQGLNPI